MEKSTKIINIKNSDKIVILGDSYSASHYTLKGKAYINNLSLFSDYNFENFSRSGDDYNEILIRVKKNEPEYHENISLREYGGKYAILISNTNDYNFFNASHEYYYANLIRLIENVKALGMYPIISTEFCFENEAISNPETRMLKGLKAIADKYNCGFIDIVTKTKLMNVKQFLPFWGNNHPATRTSWMIVDEMKKYIDTLERPKQSLKIFRLRKGIEVKEIQELMVDSLYKRAKLFKEINIGHWALTEDKKKYFDDLNVSFDYEKLQSEYLKLQNKEDVEFDEYALVDIIIPSTSDKTEKFSLVLSDKEIKVYGRYMRNKLLIDTATPEVMPEEYKNHVFDPEGEWNEIINKDGKYTISGEELKDYMCYDKFTFLLYKKGGFKLNNIYAEWQCSEDKVYFRKEEFKDAKGKELLKENKCGTVGELDNWEFTKNIKPIIPEDTVLPYSCEGCVEVDTENYISQIFNYDEEEFKREIQVKVWCRVYPKKFNYNEDFSKSCITEESVDFGKLCIQLSETNDTYPVNFEELVGLHWKEAALNVTIPSFSKGQKIKIYSIDKKIQVSKVSVKFL